MTTITQARIHTMKRQIAELRAENGRLRQERDEAREALAWHDMTTHRPTHNQKALFVFDGETMQGIYSEQAMRFYTHGTQMLQARYWMPLPERTSGE